MPAIRPPTPSQRFDAQAIERLAVLLQAECASGGGMPVEAIDGLFSAALVSPGAPIELGELLPLVLGAVDATPSEELRALLARMWDATRTRILREPVGDPMQYLPLIHIGHDQGEDESVARGEALPDEAEASDAVDVDDPASAAADPFPVGAGWALGFSFAYGMRVKEWEARLEQDEDLFHAVMDIFDLIPPEWMDGGEDIAEDWDEGKDEFDGADDDTDDALNDALDEAWLDAMAERSAAPEQPAEYEGEDDYGYEDEDDAFDDTFDDGPLSLDERFEIIGTLADTLHQCHLMRIEEATPRIPRRASAAPGRNDPCPCGSGRKFKKCHGDPARLN